MRRLRLIIFLTLCAATLSAAQQLLTPYLADSASNTRTAVIVCPGGSYSWLDMKEEGVGVAKWLQSQGINAFVLKYHVANVSAYIIGYRVLGIGNKYPKMLNDVELALQQVYHQADSLHIDTARIGVMGFSAGGHLTMMSYTHNRTAYKPHFLCPIYPVVTMADERYAHKRSRRGALGVWGQWNKPLRDSLSIEQHIPRDCPPVFVWTTPSLSTKTLNYWIRLLRQITSPISTSNTKPAVMVLAHLQSKAQTSAVNGKMNLYNGYRI